MPLSFREYARLGSRQWRGQSSFARKAVWFSLGTPDVHTRIRNTHVCNMAERLHLPEDSRVLDVGCGRAIALLHLSDKHPHWNLTGLELDDQMVKPLQRAALVGHWTNLSFQKANVTELNDAASYNLVLCMEVLEHVHDDVGLLRKIYCALRPGGYLIVTAPLRRQQQWRWLRAFTRHDVKGEFGHVRNEYLAEELHQIVTEAGFERLEIYQTFGRMAEIAFELNNLFWKFPGIRRLMVLLTFPVCLILGYPDTLHYQRFGNSFLILAQRPV